MDTSTERNALFDSILSSISRIERVGCLLDKGKKWDAFRELYKQFLPDILNRGGGYGIDPYMIDWTKHFTPIEFAAWQTIRSVGIPIYPQFPVGNVFVDFGDPLKRIAIECDGRNWHKKEKDAERDDYLGSLGWYVFRVTGRECNKPSIDLEMGHDEDRSADIRDWSLNNSEGVISAIGWKFYGKRFCFNEYFDETLDLHSNNYPV